ncbi:hypothetical protein FI667_g2505, partial [Globisporangium splendens]
MKKHQALVAVAASTGANSPTAPTSTTALSARMKGNKSRSELHSNGIKSDRDPQDDDDMSFLDIDFKIPESMHARKSGKKMKKKISKTSKKVKSTQRRGNEGNQAEAHDGESTLGNTTHRLPANMNLKAEMVDNENEFDYGDEFEDVIDEAKLGRLIC